MSTRELKKERIELRVAASAKDLIQRAMAVDPQQRYQSSAEFAEALRPFVRASADLSTRTPAPVVSRPTPSWITMPSSAWAAEIYTSADISAAAAAAMPKVRNA